MMERRGGTIVIVSAAAAVVGEGGRCAHAASKAALLELAGFLAEALWPVRHRVDVVAPELIERGERDPAGRPRACTMPS